MNDRDARAAPPEPSDDRFWDRHLWWLLVLGVCGLVIYAYLRNQAFPTASIDIRKPRLQIQAQAKTLAHAMGFSKDGLIESTVFSNDSQAKTFLEHEYSQVEADRLMANEIPVWYRCTKFCKEFDQEEFSSWISPQGTMISFDRSLPNDFALKSVSHDQAESIAHDFVRRTEPNWSKYRKLISEGAFSRPKRHDSWFVWEDQDDEFKSAHLRLYVYISGDQVTTYNKFLHVPESWERDFGTRRSYNYLLGSFAHFFYDSFVSIAGLIVVWGVITHNIRWRCMIIGGALLGLIYILNYFNDLPSLISHYSPAKSFGNYIQGQVASALTGFVYSTISGLFLFGGSEIVYRKLFSKKVAMEKLFTKVGLAQLSVFKDAIVGHLVFLMILGWTVFYYVAGKLYLHYWCPLGIENYRVLSDLLPAVSAIESGVQPAFWEELSCRIIGIGIGVRLFKNFWIANLIQAAVWSFSHSSYPQEPAYARGIELLVVGLLQGWILRRYGIVACVTAHYLLNAFYGVEPLLHSDIVSLKLQALVALVLPVSIIACARAVTRRLPDIETNGLNLSNETIPFVTSPPPLSDEPVTPFKYAPVSTKGRALLLAVLVLGIMAVVCLPRSHEANSGARLSIDRQEAVDRGKQVMRKHHVDPDGWMSCASCSSFGGGDAFQYLFERLSLSRMKAVFNDYRYGFSWSVNFFKPLKSEEYAVILDGQGHETSFSITREEDDKGASLSPDQARNLAQQYVNETHPEFHDCQFKEISSHKRSRRIDYNIEYTYPKLRVGEADYRLGVSVIGDQVGNFWQRWNIPDSWTFERQKRTTKDELLSHLRTLAQTGISVLVLVWCWSLLRTGAVRFRVPLIFTLGWTLLLLLNDANDLPLFFRSYGTTTPLMSFVTQQLINNCQGVLTAAVATFMLAGIALGALRILTPRATLLSFLACAFGNRKHDRSGETGCGDNLWLDAVLISSALIAIVQISVRAFQLVSNAVSPGVPLASSANIISFANSALPLAQPVLHAVEHPFEYGALAIVITGMLSKFVPGHWRRWAVCVAITAVMNSGERYWQDYVLLIAQQSLIMACYYFVVWKFARDNYLAYFMYFALSAILPYVKELACFGRTLFLPELTVLCIAAILPLVFACRLWFKQRRAIQLSASRQD